MYWIGLDRSRKKVTASVIEFDQSVVLPDLHSEFVQLVIDILNFVVDCQLLDCLLVLLGLILIREFSRGR